MQRRWMVSSLFLLLVSAAPAWAQDGENAAKSKSEFKIEVEIPRLGVISQDHTGTCWCFATTSFLETEVERLTKKKVDLSEMFIVANGYVEKCRRYVRLHGKAQFSEGGLSHDVIELARTYGVAPADAYSGLVAGDTTHEHEELFKLLEAVLKTVADAKRPSVKWESAVRGILEAYLGAIPREVVVDGKPMTPKDYSDNVLKIPYDDYVEVMSFGYTPFWTEGELLVPDNWMRWQKYKNVPVDAMMESLDYALRHGFSVAVDMDVSERGFNMGKGVAKLPAPLEKPGAVTQEIRDKAFENRETEDDHLMHVVGIAKDAAGDEYYLTKNSWGPTGPHGGYLYMSRNYVAMKMLGMMVHKNGIAPALKDKMKM